MNVFLNEVAETYFKGFGHLHGVPGSSFVRFELVESPSAASSPIFNALLGHVVYRHDDQDHRTKLIQVKYYDSERYASSWCCMVPRMLTELWFCETVLPAFEWMGMPLDEVMPTLYAFEHQTLDAKPSTKCAILWQHLDGFLVYSRVHLLQYRDLSLMAAKIGQFHAMSFDVRAKRPGFFTLQAPDIDVYRVSRPVVQLLKRCLQPLLGEAASAADTRQTKAVGRLQKMLAKFERRLSQPFALAADNVCEVVCHQRFTQENAAFLWEPPAKRPADVRIVNWQWPGFASLGVDLVFLLALESSDQAGLFEPLLDDYMVALRNSVTVTAVSVPNREKVLDELKRSMPLALHVLGERVIGASLELPFDQSTYPSQIWNEQRITDTYRFMIEVNLVQRIRTDF